MRRPLCVMAVILGAAVAWADDAEEAFRARVREQLLADSRPEPISGVRARIALENRVGSAFRLVRAALAYDGQPLWLREAESIGRRVDVFDGVMIDGEHSVAAAMTYRGRAFGIFTYLEGYRIRVSGGCSFEVAAGPPVLLRVMVALRGSGLAPSGDPPAVVCRVARRTRLAS